MSNKQVSWAQAVSPTAPSNPEPYTPIQPSPAPCQECAQLKAQIAALQARLEAIENAQTGNTPDKRKKPNRPEREQTQMDTAPPPPPTTKDPQRALKGPATTEAHTPDASQVAQPQWFQAAMTTIVETLTARMDAQYNAIRQEIQTLHEDVQVLKQDVQALRQEGERHAIRIDRLETANPRSSRRPTPYVRESPVESKDQNNQHDDSIK